MAAIFYDAVSGNYKVHALDRGGATAAETGQIAILIAGKNPGFLAGDKVQYSAIGSSAKSFNGTINKISIGNPYSAFPDGFFRLWVPVANVESLVNTAGGSISIVPAPSVKVASAEPVNTVVSASTILKSAAAGAAAPAVPLTDEPASSLPFWKNKKLMVAAGIVALAAFLIAKRVKGKKSKG